MLMLDYPLYDFQATVPSCLQTSSLAVVLEIFEQEQCDRLVVLNQQQCPIGLLYSARLIQKLLAHSDNKNLNLQQSVSIWGQGLIEPIQTISASERVEQLSLRLCYPQGEKHQNLDWALIDSDGRYLGLLDSSRLLRSLAKERMAGLESSGIQRSRQESNKPKSLGHQPLILLLERLPWPLMLQTGTGEVLARNPAWWQQLGALKDPEGVRQQVEAILVPKSSEKSEYVSQRAIKVHPNSRENERGAEQELTQQEASPDSVYSRCYLDSQVGTCTCVVQVQNGQERIWQFAKIPLDSPEFKVMSAESEVLLSNDLWLVLATDVTEQQQLCKELSAKNADLIQLNRLKDEFLACISHELKTPLTAVLGLSRLLVDQQLGELNERQARYAGLIHQSGRHLMSVVNDILDLTRMETGQMDLTLTPVKIQAVCDRALSEAKAIHTQTTKTTSQTQENARSTAPQFCLSIELGLDQMVADELRLRQMLVHLLSNAFKFTEISGEIGLRVSRWEGWIAFTIWDTGIGIPEHQQHLIFQKFQQLENPLTRQFEGTGLGLVLTRALARLHGGDVSFLSREGKGSHFTLLLPPTPPKTGFSEPDMGIREEEETRHQQTRENPAATRQQSGKSTHTQHHPASSQRLVLVVEAVARYIEDLTDKLKGLGYRVVIARSGTEAVEKARRLQPIAIFLNPLLPLLSGWDVLTLLKSDSATRHISVIVTATGAEKDRAFANRADGFLSLPVEHQVLAPVLEKLCTAQAATQQGLDNSAIIPPKTPLRILRLVNPQLESVNPHSSLREHRVIEVDDLDQAELLARVWQFDVILLDVESTIAQIYLKQLIQHPRLAAIPLVTCDVATTLIASKIPGLSVFPYLTPFSKDNSSRIEKTDALLSVLQIASGICSPANILVVDLTMLRDFPQVRRKQAKGYQIEKNCSISSETAERGSEWFQALIQYLQTAGFKAAMSPCWAEVLQQIRHQSVDLLLICLGESAIHKDVLKALKTLGDSPDKLPPIVVLNQRLNRSETTFPAGVAYQEISKQKKNGLESIETVVGAIATRILPRSISMEDLLNQINQALAVNGYNGKC
ncbi:hybrid sensor histidine kinase/response regulator [Nostoc sp. 'Peltigera membranacea cyanobiont' 213]|uniref:ATP-binding protein n=1 Tax=Nostoc sp. 'Peltigera membranacea cyanobiont' 213 TaxID=2014530 RepID=UPI000B955122|nr:ATP-binding protein [Nostoc sp. 'Peltigera membranacea cyanobiont' 213]OYD98378.1 hybrid sensor histidine kinase/response regulator [Nostoc sp. 'Peltigera membranacea cyanobiont' 213]